MYRFKAVVMVSAMALVSGCATVMSGTSQSVFIDTPEVQGAACDLTDAKGHQWHLPTTPGALSVGRGDGPMSIVCHKDGYKAGTVTAQETIAGATLGNIILGGGIGIFVDAMSGAAQRYPDKVVVWMEPQAWKSEAFHQKWLAEKADYEKELAKQAQAQRNAD